VFSEQAGETGIVASIFLTRCICDTSSAYREAKRATALLLSA
jgi:hypothetical protein